MLILSRTSKLININDINSDWNNLFDSKLTPSTVDENKKKKEEVEQIQKEFGSFLYDTLPFFFSEFPPTVANKNFYIKASAPLLKTRNSSRKIKSAVQAWRVSKPRKTLQSLRGPSFGSLEINFELTVLKEEMAKSENGEVVSIW